jgi:hypothetical protein
MDVPPIAIENEIRLAAELLWLWMIVAGPFALLFVLWVWIKKL